MTSKIHYSKHWARKNCLLMQTLRNTCNQLGIELVEHNDYFKKPEQIKELLQETEKGFDDIVAKQKKVFIQDMLYNQCIDWILEDPSRNLISLMAIIRNDDNSIFRIERNSTGVDYFIECKKRGNY